MAFANRLPDCGITRAQRLAMKSTSGAGPLVALAFAQDSSKLAQHFDAVVAAAFENLIDQQGGTDATATTQFFTDVARDIWHELNSAPVSEEAKENLLASFLDALCEHKGWANAVVRENPFPVFQSAADEVPRLRLKRKLCQTLKTPGKRWLQLNKPVFDFPSHTRLVSPLRQELKKPVRWMAPIFNPSGYASEAINFVVPLEKLIHPGILHQNTIYSEEFVNGLADSERTALFQMRDRYKQLRGGIVVSHQPANGFSLLPDGEYHIGRSMYETDRIPFSWVQKCNLMDEIWVPSEFNRQTFAASGVEKEKIVVIPGAVDANFFDPSKHGELPLPNKATVNFLSVFEWSSRKGWDVLLAAYLQEFSADDDVCLYLRTYLMNKPEGDSTVEIWRRIKEFAATLKLGAKAWPRIELLANQVASADLPALYKAVDCLVAPSRGEGWGRPQHEAMMMGTPVIATGWSGNTEFMTADNSYLIDYELETIDSPEPELWHYKGHRWARASVPHLRELMRKVFANPEERRAKGPKARADMLAKFSREAVSTLVFNRLLEIERKLATPSCPPAVAGKLPEPKKVTASAKELLLTWEGSFLGNGSLSHVNRAVTAELKRHPGLKVALAKTDQGQRAPCRAAVTIRHSWPPNWAPPAEGMWIHIQPWEFGALPTTWVKGLEGAMEIWVYTEYVRKVYVDSGIDPSRIKILPLGIDPKLFNPSVKPIDLPTKKKFKFLFVGGTIFRKGPDLLVQAFLDQFTAADDVCLVVKDFGASSAYKGQTRAEQIRQAAKREGAPEIIVIEDDLPPEKIAGLYRACDCLVHPYRGEGFGLPVLEAMACGLPVIVTAGGATDDFATDEFAYRIPSTRVSIGNTVGELRLIRQGWVLEPDFLELGAGMRHIFSNRVEAAETGRRASEHVLQRWTWEQTAAVAGALICDLYARISVKEPVSQSGPIQTNTAAVTFVGSLETASQLLDQQDYVSAWQAAAEAIRRRPFHPNAWLLLAKIAAAQKDIATARAAAKNARQLAPNWRVAKSFLNELPQSPAANHSDVQLPAFGQNRVSVCLIIKDEERFIAQCLETIKALAWEIIVVDTGSTDRTVEIARSFGAKIFNFEWCDDFAAARNASLEHATGDWILYLDADETLGPTDREQLMTELNAADVIAYDIPFVENARPEMGRWHCQRLFRNAPGLHFVSRIHEQIAHAVRAFREEFKLQVKYSKAIIRHFGYSDKVDQDRAKNSRNLRLLELAKDDRPNDPNILGKYALELSRAGRSDDAANTAVQAVHKMFALPRSQLSPAFCEGFLTEAATVLNLAGRHKEVVGIFSNPWLRNYPLTASHHFMAGYALMHLSDPQRAADHFKECLRKRSQPTLSPVHKDILESGPNHCLGICLNKLGCVEQAEKSFLEGLEQEPQSKGLRVELARFYRSRGNLVEALRVLCAGIEHCGRDTNYWRIGGDIVLSEPALLEVALDWTAEALKTHSQNTALIEQRAEALLLAGHGETALSFWQQANLQNARSSAALLLCEGLANGRITMCHVTESALSRAFVDWYKKLLKFNTHGIVSALNASRSRFEAHAPTACRILSAAWHEAEKASAAAA